MDMTPETLKQLLAALAEERDASAGCACDDCFDALDRYAEMILAGQPAEAVMPLIKAHLDRCTACHEELDALLDALRAAS